MKCLYCQKEIISKRSTKKFCDNNCRQTYFRVKDSVTKVVPVTVTSVTLIKESNAKDVTLRSNANSFKNWVDKDGNVTQETIKKLDEIYKTYEKYIRQFDEYKHFTCIPAIVNGKRVLTEWEKMKLWEREFGKIVNDKVYYELKFTTESMSERIAKYRLLFPDTGFVPNWIVQGWKSADEAIQNALKTVEKSTGVQNTSLG